MLAHQRQARLHLQNNSSSWKILCRWTALVGISLSCALSSSAIHASSTANDSNTKPANSLTRFISATFSDSLDTAEENDAAAATSIATPTEPSTINPATNPTTTPTETLRDSVEIPAEISDEKSSADSTEKPAIGDVQRYYGKPLSLNFKNIDVRTALQILADFTNINIVTSDRVTGNITLRLKDIPWDQALDTILKAKGLALERQHNVLWIAAQEELNTRKRAELESQAHISELKPLESQLFALNYQKAVDIQRMLSSDNRGGQRILSKQGSVIADVRTNQLFISDTPKKLEEISQFIEKVDVPIRQVQIEARIVEATDRFSRNLGVKLQLQDSTSTDHEQTSGTSPQIFSVNLPALGLNGFSPATLPLHLLRKANGPLLNLELNALEANGEGKIISNPRVITADKIQAVIEQGTELPYQVATPSGATSIQFRKANLRLEVTPQITPEGHIVLDVDVNKDSIGQQTQAGYAIDTKHIKTQILVEDGGTVVIGGIYQNEERLARAQVPWLGDIPFLGFLFKNKAETHNKNELMIFITPTVIGE